MCDTFGGPSAPTAAAQATLTFANLTDPSCVSGCSQHEGDSSWNQTLAIVERWRSRQDVNWHLEIVEQAHAEHCKSQAASSSAPIPAETPWTHYSEINAGWEATSQRDVHKMETQSTDSKVHSQALRAVATPMRRLDHELVEEAPDAKASSWGHQTPALEDAVSRNVPDSHTSNIANLTSDPTTQSASSSDHHDTAWSCRSACNDSTALTAEDWKGQAAPLKPPKKVLQMTSKARSPCISAPQQCSQPHGQAKVVAPKLSSQSHRPAFIGDAHSQLVDWQQLDAHPHRGTCPQLQRDSAHQIVAAPRVVPPRHSSSSQLSAGVAEATSQGANSQQQTKIANQHMQSTTPQDELANTSARNVEAPKKVPPKAMPRNARLQTGQGQQSQTNSSEQMMHRTPQQERANDSACSVATPQVVAPTSLSPNQGPAVAVDANLQGEYWQQAGCQMHIIAQQEELMCNATAPNVVTPGIRSQDQRPIGAADAHSALLELQSQFANEQQSQTNIANQLMQSTTPQEESVIESTCNTVAPQVVASESSLQSQPPTGAADTLWQNGNWQKSQTDQANQMMQSTMQAAQSSNESLRTVLLSTVFPLSEQPIGFADAHTQGGNWQPPQTPIGLADAHTQGGNWQPPQIHVANHMVSPTLSSPITTDAHASVADSSTMVAPRSDLRAAAKLWAQAHRRDDPGTPAQTADDGGMGVAQRNSAEQPALNQALPNEGLNLTVSSSLFEALEKMSDLCKIDTPLPCEKADDRSIAAAPRHESCSKEEGNCETLPRRYTKHLAGFGQCSPNSGTSHTTTSYPVKAPPAQPIALAKSATLHDVPSWRVVPPVSGEAAPTMSDDAKQHVTPCPLPPNVGHDAAVSNGMVVPNLQAQAGENVAQVVGHAWMGGERKQVEQTAESTCSEPSSAIPVAASDETRRNDESTGKADGVLMDASCPAQQPSSSVNGIQFATGASAPIRSDVASEDSSSGPQPECSNSSSTDVTHQWVLACCTPSPAADKNAENIIVHGTLPPPPPPCTTNSSGSIHPQTGVTATDAQSNYAVPQQHPPAFSKAASQSKAVPPVNRPYDKVFLKPAFSKAAGPPPGLNESQDKTNEAADARVPHWDSWDDEVTRPPGVWEIVPLAQPPNAIVCNEDIGQDLASLDPSQFAQALVSEKAADDPSKYELRGLPKGGVAILHGSPDDVNDFFTKLSNALMAFPHGHCRFENIDISGVPLRTGAIGTLLSILGESGATTQRLKAYKCDLGDEALESIVGWMSCMRTSCLPWEIHVSKNRITVEGFRSLIQALKHKFAMTTARTPIWLRVEDNYIDKDFVDSLFADGTACDAEKCNTQKCNHIDWSKSGSRPLFHMKYARNQKKPAQLALSGSSHRETSPSETHSTPPMLPAPQMPPTAFSPTATFPPLPPAIHHNGGSWPSVPCGVFSSTSPLSYAPTSPMLMLPSGIPGHGSPNSYGGPAMPGVARLEPGLGYGPLQMTATNGMPPSAASSTSAGHQRRSASKPDRKSRSSRRQRSRSRRSKRSRSRSRRSKSRRSRTRSRTRRRSRDRSRKRSRHRSSSRRRSRSRHRSRSHRSRSRKHSRSSSRRSRRDKESRRRSRSQRRHRHGSSRSRSRSASRRERRARSQSQKNSPKTTADVSPKQPSPEEREAMEQKREAMEQHVATALDIRLRVNELFNCIN